MGVFNNIHLRSAGATPTWTNELADFFLRKKLNFFDCSWKRDYCVLFVSNTNLFLNPDITLQTR